MAVRDRVLIESPAANLKYRKRKKPIRRTPTYEQFKAIIADVRAQSFNREAEDSGDFLEFLGLAGLGQAEAAGIKREHVDLESERIIIYRHKTDTGFVIPIYPQVLALVERLCEGRKHHEHLFTVRQARKALANACKRLGFPRFTHRSLRRLFITRALQKGIDVQTIARWQGHRDNGQLILRTYAHVTDVHTQRMAQLLTTEVPENVIEMREQGDED
jgi:integrase